VISSSRGDVDGGWTPSVASVTVVSWLLNTTLLFCQTTARRPACHNQSPSPPATTLRAHFPLRPPQKPDRLTSHRRPSLISFADIARINIFFLSLPWYLLPPQNAAASTTNLGPYRVKQPPFPLFCPPEAFEKPLEPPGFYRHFRLAPFGPLSKRRTSPARTNDSASLRPPLSSLAHSYEETYVFPPRSFHWFISRRFVLCYAVPRLCFFCSSGLLVYGLKTYELVFF